LEKSVIHPIHKKGSENDPSNYRPIALTSPVCRVLERILDKNIRSTCSRQGLISPNQYGFLPRRSCPFQLLTTLKDWYEYLDAKKNVDVVYFDYEKAFDRVRHKCLLQKLSTFGIHQQILKWIANFLVGREHSVKINDSYSSVFVPCSGCPQGSVLAPLLFLLFINDIGDAIPDGCHHKLFADDLKIYRSVDSVSDALELQAGIDSVEGWSDENWLDLSGPKTVVLRQGKSPVDFEYVVGGNPITPSREVRDLGILVDSKLTFEPHINKIVRGATIALHHLIRALPDVDLQLFMTAFKTYVRPKLEYGTEVFNPHLKRLVKRMEKPQRTFTKKVLKLKKIEFRSYEHRLQICGLDSLEHRRALADLRTTFKLLNGDYDLAPNALFQLPYRHNPRLHNRAVYKPPFTSASQHAFWNRVVNNWNSLPASLNNIANVDAFTAFARSLDSSQVLVDPVFSSFVA